MSDELVRAQQTLVVAVLRCGTASWTVADAEALDQACDDLLTYPVSDDWKALIQACREWLMESRDRFGLRASPKPLRCRRELDAVLPARPRGSISFRTPAVPVQREHPWQQRADLR